MVVVNYCRPGVTEHSCTAAPSTAVGSTHRTSASPFSAFRLFDHVLFSFLKQKRNDDKTSAKSATVINEPKKGRWPRKRVLRSASGAAALHDAGGS